MVDIHDKATRSYNMSRIRSKNTKPEIMVRKFLFSNGFRYRLHVSTLPGKPDIFLPKYKTIIFVNGCFWHGHSNCKYANIPKSNTDFWREKFHYNQIRQESQIRELRRLGWNVLKLWQCELSDRKLRSVKRILDRRGKQVI